MTVFFLANSGLYSQYSPIREKIADFAAAGQYDMAVHESQRLIFYAGRDVTPADYILLADCQAQLGNFPDAIAHYRRAYRAGTLPAAKRDTIAILAAFSAYMADMMGECATILQENKSLWSSVEAAHEAGLMEVLVLNDEAKFDGAHALLTELYAGQPATLARIDSAYAKPMKFKPRKRGLALLMSVILPGSGQAYAGRPGDGLVSLALTGGTATLGVISFLQGHYAFSLLTCALLFQKFYEGGARFAVNAIDQWNEDKIVSFKKSLNDFVISLK